MPLVSVTRALSTSTGLSLALAPWFSLRCRTVSCVGWVSSDCTGLACGYAQCTVPAGLPAVVSVTAGNLVVCFCVSDLAVAGPYHTCVITAQQQLVCFGAQGAFAGFGQTSVPPGRYMQASAGFHHTCALTTLRFASAVAATPILGRSLL